MERRDKMDDLKKNIISNIDLPPIKYKRPFVIALCGYSGTGKTTISRVFSNILGCYIVGGDRVRSILLNAPFNYEIEKANLLVSDVTKAEVSHLIQNNASVVIDKSISSKAALNDWKLLCPIVITVNLKSTDEENIKRLYMKKNKTNQTYECMPVYGDSNDYSGMYLDPEKLYNEVKMRKIYDLETFDYEINTLQPFEKVIEDTKKIANEIKQKYQD